MTCDRLPGIVAVAVAVERAKVPASGVLDA